MICQFCHGVGEVLIDGNGNIVGLKDAVMMIPCPAGCIGGTAYCCDTAGSSDRACTDDKEDVG